MPKMGQSVIHAYFPELMLDDIDLSAMREGCSRSDWLSDAIEKADPNDWAAKKSVQVIIYTSPYVLSLAKKLVTETGLGLSEIVRLAAEQRLKNQTRK